MNKISSLRFQQIFVFVASVVLMVLLIFYGYRPKNYNFHVDSVSNEDVFASRDFVDSWATEHNANEQKNSVSAIFVRSEEVSSNNVNNVTTFFHVIDESRSGRQLASVHAQANALKDSLQNELGIEFNLESNQLFIDFLTMSDSDYYFVKTQTIEKAELIMNEDIKSESQLSDLVSSQVSSLVSHNSFVSQYSSNITFVLNSLLTLNSTINDDVTNEAREYAYEAAMNNPVVVKKGTKIVGAGEHISPHIYSQLVDLELVRSENIDFLIFARIASYESVIALAAIIYIINCRKSEFRDMKVVYTLVLTFFIPAVASVYLADISSVMVTTLFFTTIAATYLGLSLGIIMSVAQILMLWPLYSFDIEYIFVSIAGILICSSIASNAKKSYNSAALIIFPSLFCVFSSVAYNWILGSTIRMFIQSAIWIGVSAMFSIVIAIGLMPIYELFSNTVSPVKLIELSQPGRPLLKRMFIEASGTYHHSMMVANLADSAAEAIGADSLLCKVAAYYHDIGKLENPKYFTENQSEGVNPHDDIEVMESVNIITNHIIDGSKLAKQNHLPEAIIKIINEHHGTTYPAYFYFKAKKIAEENGEEAPDLNDFKYKGQIPSSKESAIIMIADTCEAAIRSMKLTDPVKIEETVRDLIKKKIDQDQLSNSGLSFDDIEKIIVSFRQAYAGTFHERIQYPNEK